MSPKQKKIAAKAPPPDKIDAKDFAVLKAEKAKGRGMGLQDEKIKPGKVMKASMGEAVGYKKYLAGLKKATSEVRKEKMQNFNKKFFKTIGVFPKISKKMGGGMAKKYSVGGGADMGRSRDKDRLTQRDIDLAKRSLQMAKNKRAMQGYLPSDPMPKKMGGGMAKKYSTGMTLADMKPYGGSYVKKKAEMKASQTENVKQLTTSDDAYSPEKMFVLTRGTKKDNRARPTRIRVTDDWNAKKIVDRENSKGMNTQSVASYKLPPAYQRDYLRRQQVLQNMSEKPRSYSGPTRKMPSRRTDLKPRPMMSKFKSGVMVKVKLGRNKPTKIC